MANIPGYSGYNSWRQTEAEADFRATGGVGKEDWRDYGGGGGGGGGGGVSIPPFTFDYQAAEREILLNPNSLLNKYYKQILDEKRGDVELAKKQIEEDHLRGKRYRAEDLSTQLAEEQRTKEAEIRDTTTDLNRRGILFGQIPEGGQRPSAAPYSDIAQRFFLNPMTESQAARKQAIERVIQRQSELADITRGRDVEGINIALPRFERALEQEKLTKYRSEILPYEYQKKASQYQASYNPYMQGGQV